MYTLSDQTWLIMSLQSGLIKLPVELSQVELEKEQNQPKLKLAWEKQPKY